MCCLLDHGPTGPASRWRCCCGPARPGRTPDHITLTREALRQLPSHGRGSRRRAPGADPRRRRGGAPRVPRLDGRAAAVLLRRVQPPYGLRAHPEAGFRPGADARPDAAAPPQRARGPPLGAQEASAADCSPCPRALPAPAAASSCTSRPPPQGDTSSPTVSTDSAPSPSPADSGSPVPTTQGPPPARGTGGHPRRPSGRCHTPLQ